MCPKDVRKQKTGVTGGPLGDPFFKLDAVVSSAPVLQCPYAIERGARACGLGCIDDMMGCLHEVLSSIIGVIATR